MNELDWETSSVPFRILPTRCCLVEPVRPAGMYKGLYVPYEERDISDGVSMLVRVIGLGPGCALSLGSVYVVPVYAWEDFAFRGETFHLMDERNARAEVEGYDSAFV